MFHCIGDAYRPFVRYSQNIIEQNNIIEQGKKTNMTIHGLFHANVHASTKSTIPRKFRMYSGAVQALCCILALSTVSEAASEARVAVDLDHMEYSPHAVHNLDDRPNKRALWWPGWSPATCDVKETCLKCDSNRSHQEGSCLDPLNEVITTKEECRRVANKYIVAEKNTMYFSASLRAADVPILTINDGTHFPGGCFYYNDKIWLNKNVSSVGKCYNPASNEFPDWNKALTCFCSYDGSCLARARAVEDYKPAKSGANHTFNAVVVAFISFVATIVFY